LESSLVSGPVVSAIGIMTVFVVLVSLVTTVALMRRWFGVVEAEAVGSGPDASDGQSSAGAASDEKSDEKPQPDLLVVALATYAYHRSRGASATAPAQTTEWSSAGRVRQIASFSR